MASIARLLLSSVITMGYDASFRNTVKMNRRLTWVFTFLVITLVSYLGSLLGSMLQTVYATSALGCLSGPHYLWAVWKKEYRFRRLDHIALGMMAYLLLFRITLWHSPLLYYDNFTRWATIMKFFHINNASPTQQDMIISYHTYPVGSSLFICSFTTTVGFLESSMLVGQFFLIASALYAMFAALHDDRHVLMVSMIFVSFAVFNTSDVAIRLNNLLVDFLLPALVSAAIAGCFACRNRFWFLPLNTTVILGLLSIVKVSGLFFVVLVLVAYMVCVVRLLVRKRAGLKALVLFIMTLLVSFPPFAVWQEHVMDNFPNVSSAKHAVSMSKLGQVLTGNLSGDPQKIITLSAKSVFMFDSLASNGILIISLIMLTVLIVIGIRPEHKKFALLTWGFVNISIATYYIGILFTYLTTMPTDEALELVGFERYASSIAISALGCLIMALIWVIGKCLYEKAISKRNVRSYKSLFNKRLYQYASLALTVYAIGMFLSENSSTVCNNNQETNEVAKEIHQPVGSQSDSSMDRILAVTADKENIDSYFVQYASRYYLWDVNVDARESSVSADQEFLDLMTLYSDSTTSYYLRNENIDTRDDFNLTDDDPIALLKTYDEILILNDHYMFNALTKKLFGRTYSLGLYKVSDILVGKG